MYSYAGAEPTNQPESGSYETDYGVKCRVVATVAGGYICLHSVTAMSTVTAITKTVAHEIV